MNTIRIKCLEHVPYESSGIIQYWAEVGEHEFSRTLLYNDDDLPSTKHFDWLIVMGGPMSANDESKHRWMTKEKLLIEKAIVEGKTVIGICLGAQLVAGVLGANVHVSKAKEVGWFPINLTLKAKELDLFKSFPEEFMAMHWHSETFDIPSRAIHIASSQGCSNQGFIYKERVIGLQFHLEMTSASIIDLIENNRGDINSGKYVQSESEIVRNIQNTKSCNKLIEELLSRVLEKQPKTLGRVSKKAKET
jgi:GMP synthase-like glutamine amidotransferase